MLGIQNLVHTATMNEWDIIGFHKKCHRMPKDMLVYDPEIHGSICNKLYISIMLLALIPLGLASFSG